MLATAIRSSIDSDRAPSPTNSSTALVAPATPICAITARIRSLPETKSGFSPSKRTRIVAGTGCQNSPWARAAAMSVDPSPLPNAPSAP